MGVGAKGRTQGGTAEISGVFSSSYKDASPIGLGPTLMTCVNLNYLIISLKVLSPHTVTLGITLVHCLNFEGGVFQSIRPWESQDLS